jgi:rhombotail lipoprotein
MQLWKTMSATVLALSVSGCGLLEHAFCDPHCRSGSSSSSSLVEFLYPNKAEPPVHDTVPELHLPLRVGLAFLPSHGEGALDAAHQAELLERIKQRFKTRHFVNEIVLIPDYYLAGKRGFEGLQGVQRLYGVDVMALVSYDQTFHEENNQWSLGYLTIVGAFVLNGDRHDLSTLVDLAVVDPASRSLVLRAGGWDVRHGSSTLINEERDSRDASIQSFSAATDQMIDHFDAELTRFEAEVRAGNANVRIVNKTNSATGSPAQGRGGGGTLGWIWVALLGPLVVARAWRRSPVTPLTPVPPTSGLTSRHSHTERK